MVRDFWDCVENATAVLEDGTPKFICVIDNSLLGKKTIVIYLDELLTKKSTYRRFTDQLNFASRLSSSTIERDLKPVVERIVDDLFDRFGSRGHLEWDPREAENCNHDWQIRLLRRDLKRRGLPDSIKRDRVDMVLNELYIVEPILDL